MSKVDAMRALREARYAAATKAAPAARPATLGAAPRAVPRTAPEAPSGAAGQAPERELSASGALCGHRNIGGRSCTREADHVKNGTRNHRYG